MTKLKDALVHGLAREQVFVAENDTVTLPRAIRAAEQALYAGQPLAIAVARGVNEVTGDANSRRLSRMLVGGTK